MDEGGGTCPLREASREVPVPGMWVGYGGGVPDVTPLGAAQTWK